MYYTESLLEPRTLKFTKTQFTNSLELTNQNTTCIILTNTETTLKIPGMGLDLLPVLRQTLINKSDP